MSDWGDPLSASFGKLEARLDALEARLAALQATVDQLIRERDQEPPAAVGFADRIKAAIGARP